MSLLRNEMIKINDLDQLFDFQLIFEPHQIDLENFLHEIFNFNMISKN